MADESIPSASALQKYFIQLAVQTQVIDAPKTLNDLEKIKKQIQDVQNIGNKYDEKVYSPDGNRLRTFNKQTGNYNYITSSTANILQNKDAILKGLVNTGINEIKTEKLKDLDLAFKNNAISARGYNAALMQLQRAGILTSQELGNLSKSVNQNGIDIGKLIQRSILVIPVWMLLRNSYMILLNTLNSGLEAWKEYESSMAEIQIASGNSREEVERLGHSVMTLGAVYGTSLKDSLNAAKLFAQQGLSIEQTIDMTRTATVGAQLLGQSVSEVAENLTATTKAYNVSIADSIDLIDKWMIVQKKFAVTAKDLGEAFKTAGATAAAFGITIPEFMGHVTAIIEVTRKSGSEAANALQMIYTRLFTTGKDAIQTIAQVPVYVNNEKKAVFETTNVFRDAGDVLDELASRWSTLTESEKLFIATQIGSRRQATPFLALMDNYANAIEAQVTAYKSAGEAMNDFKIKQDTVEVKIKQMQSTWSQLGVAISQTTPWKIATDAITGLAMAFMYLANRQMFYETRASKATLASLAQAEANYNQLKNLQDLYNLQEKYQNLVATAKTPESKKFYEESLNKINQALPTESQWIGGAYVDIKSKNSINQEKLKNALGEVLKEQVFSEHPDLAGTLRQNAGIDPNSAKYKKAQTDYNNFLAQKQQEVLLEQKKKDYLELQNQLNAEEEKNEKQLLQTIDNRSNRLKDLGASEYQILQYQIEQFEQEVKLYGKDEDRLKLAQLRFEQEELIYRQLKEEADVFKTSFSGGLADVLNGKSSTKDFFKSFQTTFTEENNKAVAEGVTDRIFNETGIGNILGASTVNLKNILSGQGGTFNSALESSTYKGTFEGTKAGITQAIGASRAAASAWTGGSSSTTNQSGNIGSQFTLPGTGTGGWWNTPIGGNKQVTTIAGHEVAYKDTLQGNGTTTHGQAVGVGVQSALTAYSTYQNAKAAGSGLGTAGAIAGGVGSVILGAASAGMFGAGTTAGMLGMGALIPGIGIVLLLAGLAATLIAGSKKSTSTSVQSQTNDNKISSKLDIANRELQMVNRNLIGMRTDMQNYVLLSSSLYAEKSSLEDVFSLSAKRGLN